MRGDKTVHLGPDLSLTLILLPELVDGDVCVEIHHHRGLLRDIAHHRCAQYLPPSRNPQHIQWRH